MSGAGERAPLSREAIVASAREMVVAGGVEALSLRRLGRHLGVTAPALYAHVADKQDVLRSISESELEALAARFEELDDPDPIARIRAHGRAYVEYARDNPELFRVTLMARSPFSDDAFREANRLPTTATAFSVATVAVEEAIDAGRIKADDSRLVALTLWSAAHGVATVLQLGLGLPPELEDALIDEITDRVLAGYGA